MLVIGSPSLDDRYQQLSFKRTEQVKQDDAKPQADAKPQPANTVFITISNDEAAAVKAWKLLVAAGVQNVYILEGGINHWIATFGAEDPSLKPLATAGADDHLRYAFPLALGSRYKSCAPSPIEHEKLAFEPRIVLQLRRDKSGGGCG